MPILTPEERLGTCIAGRYRLEAILGSGGMGVLFGGVDETTDRRVAVKMLKPGHAAEAGRVARFLRETRINSTLEHPNIATVLDSGTDETGTLFLVIELLEGCTLEQELARRGVFTLREAVSIALPIARALSAAHVSGVIHRDVKPHNIFLCRTPEGAVVPKLFDFGIAKTPAGDDFETETGVLIGTPGYMAPEQARDGHCGAFTDVWGLGAVLYRCVVGHPPHGGASVPETLAKLVTEPVPPVVLDGVRRVDSSALDRALERDPQRRYQTMQAFVRALEGILAPGAGVRASDTPDLFTETLELAHPPPEPSMASERSGAYRSLRFARGLQVTAAVAVVGFVVTLSLQAKRGPVATVEHERRAPPVARRPAPVFTSGAPTASLSPMRDDADREVFARKPAEPPPAPSRAIRKRATKQASYGVAHGAAADPAATRTNDPPDYELQAGVPVITRW